MSDLNEYHARRDFERTAEPRGATTRRSKAKQPEGLRYVIQKHAARRLHYDFRLELNGVLLSWAVPKGPSLDPKTKRLAMEVEPHPIEYGSFEGRIAEGQYGAGSVVLWDTGTWQPADKDPDAAYRKGHLVFTLSGQKLRGKWHLVRTARGKGEKSWLLFKADDEFADAQNDILVTAPDSVVSGASIEDLGGGPRPKKTRKSATAPTKSASEHSHTHTTVAAPELHGAKAGPIPAQVNVQLATLAEAAPSGVEWIHEIKFDGYRVVARIQDKRVTLFTRKALDWTHRMPILADALTKLNLSDAVIDGEFVALDARGVSQFQMLQNSLSDSRSTTEDAALVYYAFDLLYYDGADLRRTPLVDRKALLRSVLKKHLAQAPEDVVSRVRLSEHVQGNGGIFFEQACKLGLEGIISKRADGEYVGTRTRDWQKIKCGKRQEFVIVGHTEPAGSRTHFGALLVAYYEQQRLVYCGRVGTGFTGQSLKELHGRLEPLATQKLDIDNGPRGSHARGVRWVEPRLVAEVAYTGFTEDGILRHPTFQGLRDDKVASEVRREREGVSPTPGEGAPTARGARRAATSKQKKDVGAAPVNANARYVKADASRVKLSNPDKVLYPNVEITKRELLEYAAMVAPRMLPHVVNRPLTLVRCPNGEGKPCFFQKHPGTKTVGLRSVPIREKEGKADYAAIDDELGLFGLVQLGVLEIHTSGAMADDFEHPNLLVFDLDPDPSVGYAEVVRCALRLREIFESAALESFVKTTGGKGLHVCVPIEPTLEWNEAKAFTQNIAKALVKESPQRYVATQSKAQRQGKIFIDYLRNGRGATFVAPYSTRARPNAPVATPLFWEELTPDLKPDHFTVRNVGERLARLSDDPFERMAGLRQKLPGSF